MTVEWLIASHYKRGKQVCLALAAMTCVLAYFGHEWYQNHWNSALLRADPDLIPGNAGLMSFAASLAKPAYAANCAICHGADLKGNPMLGAPNLMDDDWLYGNGQVSEIERTIYFGIRSGHPKAWNLAEMPAFGREQAQNARYKISPLSPGQIRDVIVYLFSIEGRSADPEASARGELVFSTVGACFDCHGSDAGGDSAIGAPNLADHIWLYGDGSAESIFRTIAVGRKEVCPAWIDRLPAATLRALAVYLYQQSHRSLAVAASR